MAITIGTQINSLEVAALLGKGGMGEVYRARDTRLKRDVAIKVLSAEFSRDPDRVTRLQREAEVLASLNHPNIAAIYDIQETEGSRYLVLELVEGETIAERLARGPIPIDEALAIARGVCEAVEAAHEHGIVHRDLKPSNVKITPDGRVKVLDFGLARMQESAAQSPNSTDSPTLMHTGAGVIMGTASYMSPEQARGKNIDKRSDVWSFGCVLYEMLSGTRAFEGEDIADIIAAIVRGQPDWNRLPASTPAPIRRLVKLCLEKDRRERLPDITMARIEIKDALAVSPEIESKTTSLPLPAITSKYAIAAWTVAGVLAIAVAAMLFVWAPWREPSLLAPIRLNAELGADVSLASSVQGNSALAISPDGSVLAFVGEKDGASQIYIRRLSQLPATPLTGTAGAISPFFSPEGQWIGFFADGKLKKISVNGGAPTTLCDAPAGRGASWGEDGTIVFHPNGTGPVGISRVSDNGGTPEVLTSTGKDTATHRWPQILPGGKSILFTASTSLQNFAEANIVVQTLTLGASKVLYHGGYHAQYLDSGHLVFVHDGTLFAVPFDLNRLEISGQPVPIVEGVATAVNTGAVQFAISRNGTFVHLPGGNAVSNTAPRHVDEPERPDIVATRHATDWSDPEISPDGLKLAMDISEGATSAIWIYECARPGDSPDSRSSPRYKAGLDPDSLRIVFASEKQRGAPNLYWQRADGTGDVQPLTNSPNRQIPGSWHPSGKYLAFEESFAQTAADIMILPMEGDEASGWKPGKPYAFANSNEVERGPMFSPDGHWIAYTKVGTGGTQVVVRPFPGPGGEWQVSRATNGGSWPVWSRSKKRQELVYLSNDNHIVSVSYHVQGDAFVADKTTLWAEPPIRQRLRLSSYTMHPDGERIVAFVPNPQTHEKNDKVVYTFNFFDELRSKAPPKK